MSRSLSAEMQAVASAEVVRPFYLIDMEFSSPIVAHGAHGAHGPTGPTGPWPHAQPPALPHRAQQPST